MVLRSMGEWFSAYQRVTHYFRALDVWQPPPHLLALAVLERALCRADEEHGLTPIRLAMEEVHALLSQQASAWHDAADAGRARLGSVCWRLGSWLADGEKRDLPRDAVETARLRPVPPAAPGPMAAQPLELSPLARTGRALTVGIRQLRLGAGWRRRHA